MRHTGRAWRIATALLLGGLCLGSVAMVGWLWHIDRSLEELHRELRTLRSPVASLATGRPWTPLVADSAQAARRVRHGGATYDSYLVDLNATELAIYWKDPQGQPFGSLDRLRAHLERDGQTLVFATNAGMYTPEQAPVGLYIERGALLQRLNLKDSSDGNFFLKPNGVLVVWGNTAEITASTTRRDLVPRHISVATQSGPLLLSQWSIHSGLNPASANRAIRSGVGLINSRTLVFAISNAPVTLYEFATLFRDVFNCSDALYLDGAVSLMYLPALGRYDRGGTFAGILAVVKGGRRGSDTRALDTVPTNGGLRPASRSSEPNQENALFRAPIDSRP